MLPVQIPQLLLFLEICRGSYLDYRKRRRRGEVLPECPFGERARRDVYV